MADNTIASNGLCSGALCRWQGKANGASLGPQICPDTQITQRIGPQPRDSFPRLQGSTAPVLLSGDFKADSPKFSSGAHFILVNSLGKKINRSLAGILGTRGKGFARWIM